MLAQTPENLFQQVKSISEIFESLLEHIVPKTVKGSFFSKKVSPGQSRIYLAEENHEKPNLTDLSLNFNSIYEELNMEPTVKEQFANLSMIEKSILEEETEEFFLFSRDRATPVLVNLDEIVEEVQERRSKTPSKMYELPHSFERPDEAEDLHKLVMNGRFFRKSNEHLMFKPQRPKMIKPVPPLSSPGFTRKIRRSRSSQDLTGMNLLDYEDYKEIGTKDLYDNINVYEEKHYRPSRGDWID